VGRGLLWVVFWGLDPKAGPVYRGLMEAPGVAAVGIWGQGKGSWVGPMGCHEVEAAALT
jgi:hypothetical protein